MKSSRMPILFNLPESLETAEIYLASDIHNGSAEFDEKRWELFEELLKKPNAYVIFAGDQMEYATRTSKSDVYTQKMPPSQQKIWWIEHLYKYRDKIICLTEYGIAYGSSMTVCRRGLIYSLQGSQRNKIPPPSRREGGFLHLSERNKP